MKTCTITSTFLIIFLANISIGQDCYLPLSGSTLYTTDDASYNLPVVSGLVTSGELHSGNWKVINTTGSVQASMIDNSGRTSTLQLSGEGQVMISNESTDLTDNNNLVSQCVQAFQVRNYNSASINNPDLENFCPINVVVVIDESASIAASNIDASIREGVMVFGNVLSNSGSQMAVVEYDSRARRVTINNSNELQPVTPQFLNGLSSYLDNDYYPISDQFKLIGGTNWQDALIYANNVEGADFVLMLTDGNPTFYNTAGLSNQTIAGEGERFDLTALKYAQDAANNLKRAEKHLFVVGVGMSNTSQPIIDISGNERFEFEGDINSFVASDYVLVAPDEVEKVFAMVAIETCGTLIPTIGEWGIINLFLLLVIIGVVTVRQTVPIKLKPQV